MLINIIINNKVNAVCIILGLCLCIISIFILINTNSKAMKDILFFKFLFLNLLDIRNEKNSKIDYDGLKNFTAIGNLIIGLEIIMMGMLYSFGYKQFVDLVIILMSLTLIHLFNGSQRYDLTNYDDNNCLKKDIKLTIIFVDILIALFVFTIVVITK